MPITLPCTCGRTLSVGEEHAGQLTRCPGCQTIHKVPDPEPEFEVVEEPKPIRAKVVSAPEPAGYTLKECGRDRDDDEEDRPRRKKRRRSAGSTRRKSSGFNFAMAWRIFAGLFFILIGIFGVIVNIGENNWKNIGRASVMILIGGTVLLYGFAQRE